MEDRENRRQETGRRGTRRCQPSSCDPASHYHALPWANAWCEWVLWCLTRVGAPSWEGMEQDGNGTWGAGGPRGRGGLENASPSRISLKIMAFPKWQHMASKVEPTFSVKTIHYLCFITHLYTFPYGLRGDFGWKRLRSYNHTLFILDISTEHNSSPSPQKRIRERQGRLAFYKPHPFSLCPCGVQCRAKPAVVGWAFNATFLSA